MLRAATLMTTLSTSGLLASVKLKLNDNDSCKKDAVHALCNDRIPVSHVMLYAMHAGGTCATHQPSVVVYVYNVSVFIQ